MGAAGAGDASGGRDVHGADRRNQRRPVALDLWILLPLRELLGARLVLPTCCAGVLRWICARSFAYRADCRANEAIWLEPALPATLCFLVGDVAWWLRCVLVLMIPGVLLGYDQWQRYRNPPV